MALTLARSAAVLRVCSVRVHAQAKIAPKEAKKSGSERFKLATGLPTPLVNGKQFPLQLGFTKTNELFVGRLAMLGFASSLIGEILTGKGALAQFGYETGLDGIEVDAFIVGLVLFNVIAAVLPTSQRFVPEEQEAAQSPADPPKDPRASFLDVIKRFFSIRQFGFTKENEIFVGRFAQIGFALSLVGEALTGKGTLAQFDIETGLSLKDTEFGLICFVLFLLYAAANEGTGEFVDDV